MYQQIPGNVKQCSPYASLDSAGGKGKDWLIVKDGIFVDEPKTYRLHTFTEQRDAESLPTYFPGTICGTIHDATTQNSLQTLALTYGILWMLRGADWEAYQEKYPQLLELVKEVNTHSQRFHTALNGAQYTASPKTHTGPSHLIGDFIYAAYTLQGEDRLPTDEQRLRCVLPLSAETIKSTLSILYKEAPMTQYKNGEERIIQITDASALKDVCSGSLTEQAEALAGPAAHMHEWIKEIEII